MGDLDPGGNHGVDSSDSSSASAENTQIAITICGDGGCGKSSITLRLVRQQWSDQQAYDPTIEDSYSVSRTVDGTAYRLALTDTAGQEEYRGLWAASNLAADAFLLVYDITSPDSLVQLEHFNGLIDIEAETRLEALGSSSGGGYDCNNNSNNSRAGGKGRSQQQRHRRTAAAPSRQPALARPVKIVAGNKCDLQHSRRVEARTGLEWARSRGCGFMETSARHVVNIEETFALIVRRVVEARRVAAEAEAAAAAEAELRSSRWSRRRKKGAGDDDDDGGGGGGGGSDADGGGGTRRAVTRPLTPIQAPGGAGKWFGEEKGDWKERWGVLGRVRRRERWKHISRSLNCCD